MSEIEEIQVPDTGVGERLDRFIASLPEYELSRSFVQKLIQKGCITVQGLPVKANTKLKQDQTIYLQIPVPEKIDLVAQDIPLDVMYEDTDILVINKQPGLVVHPGPGNWDSTLVNALLFHIQDLSSIGGIERPGIVHRLDRDTYGVMVVAKNDRAHTHLSQQFAEGAVEKYYTAIVIGRMKENPLIIEEPIGRHPKYRQKMTVIPGGRYAKTVVKPLEVLHSGSTLYTCCWVRIYTGRTHQIRVHLSSRGLPVVGDPVYSKSWARSRVPCLLLAASKISFTHPRSGERVTFTAELPPHMRDFIWKHKEKSEL